MSSCNRRYNAVGNCRVFAGKCITGVSVRAFRIITAYRIKCRPRDVTCCGKRLFITGANNCTFRRSRRCRAAIDVVSTRAVRLIESISANRVGLCNGLSRSNRCLYVGSPNSCCSVPTTAIVFSYRTTLTNDSSYFIMLRCTSACDYAVLSNGFLTVNTQFSCCADRCGFGCMIVSPHRILTARKTNKIRRSLPNAVLSSLVRLNVPCKICIGPCAKCVCTASTNSFTTTNTLVR